MFDILYWQSAHGLAAPDLAADLHAALRAIDGPFALVARVRRTGETILARDPGGTVPLSYALDPLRFGPRDLALARVHGPAQADASRLAGFLLDSPHVDDLSFYHGVRRVMPGALVRLSPSGAARYERWWTPRPDVTGPLDARLARLSAALDASIAGLVQGQARVAAHLSSGHDSSLIVARAAPHCPLVALTGVPLGAPSALPPPYIADESLLAAETANRAGVVAHHRVQAPTADVMALLDTQLDALQAPFRNLVNLGWLSASLATAKGSGCALLLEGGYGNVTLSAAGVQQPDALLWPPDLKGLARWWTAHRGPRPPALALARRAARMALDAAQRPFGFARLRRRLSRDTYLDLRHPAAAAARAALAPQRVPGAWRGDSRLTPDDRALHYAMLDGGDLAGWARDGFGVRLADPFADRAVMDAALAFTPRELAFDGCPRAVARALLGDSVAGPVRDQRQRGVQGMDWPLLMAASRPALAAEVDRARHHPLAAALVDLDRLARDLDRWSAPASPMGPAAMEADMMMQTAGALRFLRWLAEAPASGAGR